MTKEQFYESLDGKFDARQRPEEILKWLEDVYEQSQDSGEVHIACTSELAAFCRSVSDYQNSVKYYEEVLEALRPAFWGGLFRICGEREQSGGHLQADGRDETGRGTVSAGEGTF